MVKSTVALVTLLLLAGRVLAGNAVEAGAISLDRPTFVCLGTAWAVSGDDNVNATAACEYRPAGPEKWRRGPELFRISASLFAGSVFGLEPGTAYELRLTLADADDDLEITRTLAASTRAPVIRSGSGRTLYVRPGDGGGSGSATNPFRGLAAADRVARPDDLIMLHAGIYAGEFTPRTMGIPGHPVVWRGDGAAVLDGRGAERLLAGSDSHDLVFEHLDFRDAKWLAVFNRAQRIAVRRCRFTGGDYGIVATGQEDGRTVEDFEITDNIFEGPCRWPRSKGIEDPRGIQIAGRGHVIAFNRLTGYADGIDTFHSMPCAGIDIYRNDISGMTDDGIELDYSERNVRCFENRLTNCFMGISLQPVYGGPVYVVRNAMVNLGQSVFKLHNSPRGGLLYHNTAVKAGMPFILATSDPVSHCVSRNNLFIGSGGPYAFESTAPMESCDFDFDGFAGGPWDLFLKWNGIRYASLDDVRTKAPVERHAVRLDPAGCFAAFSIRPPEIEVAYPPSVNDLRLAIGSGAVDRGERIPGINDDFEGTAPDLGAFELGTPLPEYGPRPDARGR